MSSSVLIALCAVVGAIGLFNLLLLFGVIGRLRTLQDMVQQTANRDPDLPAIGTTIGAFSVTAQDGGQLAQADLAQGDLLVGFFTPGCQPCSEVRAKLLEEPPALPFIAFVDASEDVPDVKVIADSLATLGRVAMTKADDAVMRAFKPAGFPTLIRMSRGAVAASGHRLNQVL